MKAPKRLGILGGMSWVSTQLYYRLLNEAVSAARGRQHSAELMVASVDFQPIVDAQVKGDWARAGALLADRAQALERAGCDAFLIASNTMHRVFEQVQEAVRIPGLSIFDATAAAVRADGRSRVGMLGTRYTMGDPFFVEAYRQHGVELVVPAAADATRVNAIIFKELIHDVVTPASAVVYRGVVERLISAGAEGVVLGCTEISLLLKPGDVAHALYDTTALHAAAAAAWLDDDAG